MKERANNVKSTVMTTIAPLVTTAFGLIATLAGNDAIKTIIAEFFKTWNEL